MSDRILTANFHLSTPFAPPSWATAMEEIEAGVQWMRDLEFPTDPSSSGPILLTAYQEVTVSVEDGAVSVHQGAPIVRLDDHQMTPAQVAEFGQALSDLARLIDGRTTDAPARPTVEHGANVAESLPPCPPWCRSLEVFGHHNYDSFDPVTGAFDPVTGEVSRFHVSAPPMSPWHLTQFESNLDGRVTLGPVLICVPAVNEELTAPEARSIAAALTAGADALEAATR